MTKFQSQAGGSKHIQPDDIELIQFLKTFQKRALHRALQKDMNGGKWT